VAGGGFVAGLAPELSRGTLLLGFGAIVLFAGLLGELIVGLRSLRTARSVECPPGAAPADGRVGRLIITGARGEPNTEDPRFSSFRALEPATTNGGAPVLRPAGTPPPLLGRVGLVSLFIGRDGRSWSDEEIAQAHAAMTRAGEWIEREAIRWHAPVNLALAATYFVDDNHEQDEIEMTFQAEGGDVGPIEAHAMTKALIDSSRAASRLGFRDAPDWMTQIRSRIDADTLVWLIHPRRAGRSLAVPLDLTELSGVSLAVCYARESSFPEPLFRPPLPDPVTIAHELLHLFGATDKYGTALRSYPPRTVSSRDIMRLSESRLSRLRVDRLTAMEVGWFPGG